MAALPRCVNVLVTGCNRGIGLEFVRQFLKSVSSTSQVFATCRSLAAENATELKNLAASFSNLHLLELEVTDTSSIERCAEKVGHILGDNKGLNVLMNNAGIVQRQTVHEVTKESMLRVYKTNTVGPLMMVKYFLPLLKEAVKHPYTEATSFPRALILNMSSKVGSVEDNSSGKNYPYRASKAALNMTNKSLAVDLKGDGITAVLLHPGWVQTDMGGPNAITPTEESVAGMMKVISGLEDSKSGKWYDFRGNEIPW